MSRYQFGPYAVGSGQRVRVDTSPSVDSQTTDIATPSNQMINRFVLKADLNTGLIPEFLGPDNMSTLYLKYINASGVLTGPVITASGAYGDKLDTPGVYVPGAVAGQTWGANLLAKLQAGQLGVLAGHGDSLMQGMYATSLRTGSWFGLLTADLQAKWGDGGSGFFSTANSSVVMTALSVVTGNVTAYAAAGELWTTTGSWTAATGGAQGVGIAGLQAGANGDAATTPAHAVRGRYIDILHGGASAYSFTYSIDGASAVTVTPGTGYNITTVDTGVAAEHTVAITTVTGATAMLLNGVRGRNGAGIICDRYAVYGYGSSRFNNSDGNRSASRSGGSNSASSTMQADMLLYTLMANDAASATPVTSETLAQNIQSNLTGFRTSVYGGTAKSALDVGIVVPFFGKYDGTAADGTTAPQAANYASRVAGLCRAQGYAMVDMNAAWKNSWDYARAQSYLSGGTSTSEKIHLSDTGSAAQETQIKRMFQAAGLL